MEKGYNHKEIEKKWQEIWTNEETYKASNDTSKPKKYILDMFPYPSGAGLHVGHPKGYIATDILSRMYRMQGLNVLHPMGWDAFGLPAEQFAIKNKTHPKIAVNQNVETFKKQLSIIGLDYDWTREVNTTDSEYYKWTQWVFLQMFKKGLAFESHEPINWCPSCKTGLANEDLEDGKCERCGSVIEQKPLRQWVLRITDYAERMLADLDKLDKWPESVKTSQRNWIGKSEGAEIDFQIKNTDLKITVFTTRPDTLFGVTYVVLAPESSLVFDLKDSIENWNEAQSYIEETKKKSPLDRQKGTHSTDSGQGKTGVQLKGIFAVNPANGEEVPVWIADYVLADYGTGAVMAVPAHDERDFEFAKKYELPIKQVVAVNWQGKGDWSIREDIETLHDSNPRRTITVALENKKGEILIIEEPDTRTLIGGGIDEGETPEEAALREIKEETGYINVKLSSRILENYFAHSFRISKSKNIKSNDYLFYAYLDNDLKVESEADNGRHILKWISKEKVSDTIPETHHHNHIWKLINNPVFTQNGILVNSGNFSGLTSEEAKQKITEFVGGKMKTTYKLRDWVFSRQRYWGEPIPLVHVNGKVYPIPESDLPLKLPEVENYEPSDSGESPLADISEWVNVRGFVNDKGEFVVSPNGEIEGRRETNTMPQWAGSCWYYLRYIDPKNSETLVDKNLEKYWQPVDVYVGGMEHSTRHLIYARFWHKFLFDIGAVSTEEPFTELHTPGPILAEDGRRMSKRWGNVVNPDDMVERFGADAFRLYEAFMGPFDDAIAWNTDGVVGTRRFVERVVRMKEYFVKTENENLTRELHKLIKKVTHDIPAFKFNTCVSSMMSFVNSVEKEKAISEESFNLFLRVLAPFAPHITEELWKDLGNKNSIHTSKWPQYDESKLESDTITIIIQVNGKVRGKLVVSAGLSQNEIEMKAMEDENVKKFVTETPKNIIYVPNKILNIVL